MYACLIQSCVLSALTRSTRGGSRRPQRHIYRADEITRIALSRRRPDSFLTANSLSHFVWPPGWTFVEAGDVDDVVASEVKPKKDEVSLV